MGKDLAYPAPTWPRGGVRPEFYVEEVRAEGEDEGGYESEGVAAVFDGDDFGEAGSLLV
jgi:hypothetical protein